MEFPARQVYSPVSLAVTFFRVSTSMSLSVVFTPAVCAEETDRLRITKNQTCVHSICQRRRKPTEESIKQPEPNTYRSISGLFLQLGAVLVLPHEAFKNKMQIHPFILFHRH